MITLGLSDWPSVPEEPLCELGLSPGCTFAILSLPFWAPARKGGGSLDDLESHCPLQLTSEENPTGLGKNLLLLGASPPGPGLHRPTPPIIHKWPRRALGTFQPENQAPPLECQADSVGQGCPEALLFHDGTSALTAQARGPRLAWLRVWESSQALERVGVLAQAKSDTSSPPLVQG